MAGQVPVVSECTRHPGMEIVYVCVECRRDLICIRCMVESHNGHQTVNLLTDYVSEQTCEIERCMDLVSKTEFSELRKDLQNSDEQIRENGRNFQEIRENIKRHGEALKVATDKVIEHYVKFCDEKERKNVEILSTFQTKLSKYVSEDKNVKLKRCQKVLRSGTDVERITLAQGDGRATIVPPTLGALQTVTFKAGTISGRSYQHESIIGVMKVDGKAQQFGSKDASCTIL